MENSSMGSIHWLPLTRLTYNQLCWFSPQLHSAGQKYSAIGVRETALHSAIKGVADLKNQWTSSQSLHNFSSIHGYEQSMTQT